MVSSISGASAAQAVYAPRVNTGPAEATTPPAPPVDDSAPAATQSDASAAAARLGDQLGADADAARVQRAVDEAGTTAAAGDTDAADETASGAQAAQETAGGVAQAGGAGSAGGAGAAGGASAASSSSSTDNDYVAEADTNADKTVSDEEQAAYDVKLRQQTEKQAEQRSVDTDAPADQSAAVRAAYGQDAATAPALDITA